MDFPAAVGREDVAGVLDPDQVVGPVAPDPLVADRVARPLGPGRLGPRGGHGSREQHERQDRYRDGALTALHPHHGNRDCLRSSLAGESKHGAPRCTRD